MGHILKQVGLAGIVVASVLSATSAAYATADGCAVVVRTRDGFLAVRAGPGTRWEEIDRLRPGQIILTNHVSDYPYAGQWWRIGGVMDSIGDTPRPLHGWVYSGYLTPINC